MRRRKASSFSSTRHSGVLDDLPEHPREGKPLQIDDEECDRQREESRPVRVIACGLVDERSSIREAASGVLGCGWGAFTPDPRGSPSPRGPRAASASPTSPRSTSIAFTLPAATSRTLQPTNLRSSSLASTSDDSR
jgi:hypothetical protein